MLLISSELDEVLALADRIAVMYRGRIVGVVDRGRGQPRAHRPAHGRRGRRGRRGRGRRRRGRGDGHVSCTPRTGAVTATSDRATEPPGPSGDGAGESPNGRVAVLAGVRLADSLVVPVLALVHRAGHRRAGHRLHRPRHARRVGRVLRRSRPGAVRLVGHRVRRRTRRLWHQLARHRRAAIGRTLVEATPLALAGLSVALAFRAGLFNIGAAGQIVIGATCAGWVGLHLGPADGRSTSRWRSSPGSLGGAVWGGIAGVLKARTGAHEVITTIMLNYISYRLLDYALRTDAFQRPGRDDPISKAVAESARLPEVSFGDITVHAGLFLALAAAVVVWWLLDRSTVGFRLRAVGTNPFAARYAGMSDRRHVRAGDGRWPAAWPAWPARPTSSAGRASASPAATTRSSASTPSPWPCWAAPARSGVLAAAFLFGVLRAGLDRHAGGHVDAGRHHRRHPGADHPVRGGTGSRPVHLPHPGRTGHGPDLHDQLGGVGGYDHDHRTAGALARRGNPGSSSASPLRRRRTGFGIAIAGARPRRAAWRSGSAASRGSTPRSCSAADPTPCRSPTSRCRPGPPPSCSAVVILVLGALPGRRTCSARRIYLVFGIALALFVVALLAWAARGDDISIIGLLDGTLRRSIPLALGALAGVLCERSGVVNIAIEGMLLTGAFAARHHRQRRRQHVGGPALRRRRRRAARGVPRRAVDPLPVDQIIGGTVINFLALGDDQLPDRPGPRRVPGPQRARLVPCRSASPDSRDCRSSDRCCSTTRSTCTCCSPLSSGCGGGCSAHGGACGSGPSASTRAPPTRWASTSSRTRYRSVILGGAVAGLGGTWFTLDAVEQLRREHDRWPGVHRPRRADLRALAPGGGLRRRPRLRVLGGAAGPAGRCSTRPSRRSSC